MNSWTWRGSKNQDDIFFVGFFATVLVVVVSNL